MDSGWTEVSYSKKTSKVSGSKQRKAHTSRKKKKKGIMEDAGAALRSLTNGFPEDVSREEVLTWATAVLSLTPLPSLLSSLLEAYPTAFAISCGLGHVESTWSSIFQLSLFLSLPTSAGSLSFDPAFSEADTSFLAATGSLPLALPMDFPPSHEEREALWGEGAASSFSSLSSAPLLVCFAPHVPLDQVFPPLGRLVELLGSTESAGEGPVVVVVGNHCSSREEEEEGGGGVLCPFVTPLSSALASAMSSVGEQPPPAFPRPDQSPNLPSILERAFNDLAVYSSVNLNDSPSCSCFLSLCVFFFFLSSQSIRCRFFCRLPVPPTLVFRFFFSSLSFLQIANTK